MLKRILPILLAAALLTGCTGTVTQDTTVNPTTQPTLPVLMTLYDPDSAVEQQTGGAVKAFALDGEQYRGLALLDQGLLAISHDGILLAMQTQQGEVYAKELTALTPGWQPQNLAAGQTGVLYYAPDAHQVVVLDNLLQQTQIIKLPEEALGAPLLQGDKAVFYCTAEDIRAIDLQTGVSRMVRQHSYAAQTLTGSYFDDSVIGCRITEQDGSQQILYLRADTGEVLGTDTDGYTLQTWQDRYFAAYTDQAEPEYVYGTRTGEPMLLRPEEASVTGALSLGGAVGYAQTDNGLKLSFYDLDSGLRTAQVVLPQVGEPQAILADGAAVWLIAQDVLYRWDITATPVTEQTVYTAHRYTPDAPDTEGLALCQSRAEQLQQTYGVTIYLWDQAQTLTEDYTQQAEYRVDVTNESLNEIEGLLQAFPEGFLENTGKVTFYLVKELKNGKPCQLYREGADCHVILDTTQPGKSFLWGLGFAIDTKVLGNSRDFDTWDSLNPKKFEYTYDYEANDRREDADKYLDSFVDQESMSFPTEDRSRIFAYAMLPEGAQYFQNKTLQKKLLRVCEGIREAYDLEKSEEIFLWEQYLDEPIAKK